MVYVYGFILILPLVTFVKFEPDCIFIFHVSNDFFLPKMLFSLLSLEAVSSAVGQSAARGAGSPLKGLGKGLGWF